MTELSVFIPKELAVTPETLISEQQLPLIPADRLRGIIHPDRLPFLVARQEDIEHAIALHEDAIDPHPQYAKDSDLATHASDQTLHLHDGAIANAQVAANAAIDWSKIDKTGAAAADVGATSALHALDQSIHLPATGISNNQVAANAAIAWSKISKVGATAADIGAASSTHTHSGLAIESATAPSNPATGQRWRDTNDLLVWFWSGQYWLSEQIFIASNAQQTFSTSNQIIFLLASANYNFFFLDWRIGGAFIAPQNASAYWFFNVQRLVPGTSGAVTIISGSLAFSDITITSGNWIGSKGESLNLHQDLSSLSIGYYRFGASLVGSAGNSVINFQMNYRLAKR